LLSTEPRQRKIFFSSRSSPVRQRYSFRSAQSQGSCCRNTGRLVCGFASINSAVSPVTE